MPPSRLRLYDEVAHRAAALVVSEYSTSFGLATRLLPAPRRSQIRDLYALVRLADEVVDGASLEADGDRDAARQRLDLLERETDLALATGYSTNVLVHAFAATARQSGIGTELTAPFFASMRTDLERTVHDEESFGAYVHGSAEVVGLMCLRVFLLDEPAHVRARRYEELRSGACALGAAFQKINFLRDLGDDAERLGRSYFAGVDPRSLSDDVKRAIVADIESDLAVARTAAARLPAGCRPAVALASSLFEELTRRLDAAPAGDLVRTRVSVPAPVKVQLALRVLPAAVRPALLGGAGALRRPLRGAPR